MLQAAIAVVRIVNHTRDDLRRSVHLRGELRRRPGAAPSSLARSPCLGPWRLFRGTHYWRREIIRGAHGIPAPVVSAALLFDWNLHRQ